MTTSALESRRRLLKLFAGAPKLPLMSAGGSAFATTLLAGCGGGGDDVAAATYRSSSFTGMAAPTLAMPAAMATTSVGSNLNVTLSDGSKKSFALA